MVDQRVHGFSVVLDDARGDLAVTVAPHVIILATHERDAGHAPDGRRVHQFTVTYLTDSDLSGGPADAGSGRPVGDRHIEEG